MIRMIYWFTEGLIQMLHVHFKGWVQNGVDSPMVDWWLLRLVVSNLSSGTLIRKRDSCNECLE